MKITKKILHIPPYISTTWDVVWSISAHEGVLHIKLKDSSVILIPHLSKAEFDQIFSSHREFLETLDDLPGKTISTTPLSLKNQDSKNQDLQDQNHLSNIDKLVGSQLRFVLGTPEGLASNLQHNSAYSDLPLIPDDVLAKITQIAKIVSQEDIIALPLPVENCNCIYCQISRALHRTIQGQQSSIPDHPALNKEEEQVEEEDLHFDEWYVSAKDNKLYTVTHKLDAHEQYSVYLGDPVGCTCGKPNCEHIVAVLRSYY